MERQHNERATERDIARNNGRRNVPFAHRITSISVAVNVCAVHYIHRGLHLRRPHSDFSGWAQDQTQKEKNQQMKTTIAKRRHK